MHNNLNIIVSGGSITNDDPWPTWATFVSEFYQHTNFQNVSIKGLGNKVIILRAVKAAYQSKDPVLLLLQLTALDKWDWYVTDQDLCQQLKNEKHPLLEIEPGSNHGFWSTGSHFPSFKEYYRDHYFNLEYQAYETVLTLQWFEMLCQKQGWQYHVILDGPIFSVPESQLIQGLLEKDQCYKTNLLNNTLCDILRFNHDHLYLPGLMGYACLNDLDWYTPRFGAHPGSLVHYLFFQDTIIPVLNTHVQRKNVDLQLMMQTARKYQGLLSTT